MNDRTAGKHDSADRPGVDLTAVLVAVLVIVIVLWFTHEFWLPLVWPN